MKKPNSAILFLTLLGLSLALASYSTILVAPVDSLSTQEIAPVNYLPGRHVIGSGGVIGARSQNYIHHGTAGQTIIGGANNVNHFLISGFWIQPAGPTEVNPAEQPGLPTTFALHQNYPNPFNPGTSIEYDLPIACLVTVEIFNTVGQRIRLVSSQVQGPGRANVVWDGRDDRGQAPGSAMYFYRITALAVSRDGKNQTIQFQQTKKMLLVK